MASDTDTDDDLTCEVCNIRPHTRTVMAWSDGEDAMVNTKVCERHVASCSQCGKDMPLYRADVCGMCAKPTCGACCGRLNGPTEGVSRMCLKCMRNQIRARMRQQHNPE